MAVEFYPFQIGDFRCFAIRDADDGDRNVLLIKAGARQLLIETGNGDATSPPGLLLDRLRAMGISPVEIDVVIATHADFDHIAGAVDASGRLVFPWARCVLSRPERAYWAANPQRVQPSDQLDAELLRLVNSLPGLRLPYLDHKLDLVEFGAEIAPGIRALDARGHTPGHTAIAISSWGEQMIFIGDLAYDPNDIGNPAWHALVDVDPAQAAATRERLFEQAAQEETLLMAYHFPFPGLGFIVRHGPGWKWQPLDSATTV